MPATAASTPIKADYGIDAPAVLKSMITRGVLFAVLGALIWYMNRVMMPGRALGMLYVLGAIGLAYLAAAAVMLWSSRVAKMRVRDRLLDSLGLRGDEKVLDVGCGRGLLLIGAAKRLTSGRVTGVDIWSREDLSSNSAEAARANAKAEGVADRVRIEDADARKLPFANESFDVVLSSLAIHNIEEQNEREEAIAEMARVLRPGGRLALFDIQHTGDYARQLRRLGFAEVQLSPISLLWCMPARSVTARKA
jgi:ubiquinone/menaquinone biosynthesis C-methylase UbiE